MSVGFTVAVTTVRRTRVSANVQEVLAESLTTREKTLVALVLHLRWINLRGGSLGVLKQSSEPVCECRPYGFFCRMFETRSASALRLGTA